MKQIPDLNNKIQQQQQQQQTSSLILSIYQLNKLNRIHLFIKQYKVQNIKQIKQIQSNTSTTNNMKKQRVSLRNTIHNLYQSCVSKSSNQNDQDENYLNNSPIDEKKAQFFKLFINEKKLLRMKIQNIVTIPKQSFHRAYTLYQVQILTQQLFYQTQKRYSQFEGFYKRVAKASDLNLNFPKKTYWTSGNQLQVINCRIIMLNEFIHSILEAQEQFQDIKYRLFDFFGLYEKYMQKSIDIFNRQFEFMSSNHQIIQVQIFKLNQNPKNISTILLKLKKIVLDIKIKPSLDLAKHILFGIQQKKGLIQYAFGLRNDYVAVSCLQLIINFLNPQLNRASDLYLKVLQTAPVRKIIVQQSNQDLFQNLNFKQLYFTLIKNYQAKPCQKDLKLIFIHNHNQNVYEEFKIWSKQNPWETKLEFQCPSAISQNIYNFAQCLKRSEHFTKCIANISSIQNNYKSYQSYQSQSQKRCSLLNENKMKINKIKLNIKTNNNTNSNMNRNTNSNNNNSQILLYEAQSSQSCFGFKIKLKKKCYQQFTFIERNNKHKHKSNKHLSSNSKKNLDISKIHIQQSEASNQTSLCEKQQMNMQGRQCRTMTKNLQRINCSLSHQNPFYYYHHFSPLQQEKSAYSDIIIKKFKSKHQRRFKFTEILSCKNCQSQVQSQMHIQSNKNVQHVQHYQHVQMQKEQQAQNNCNFYYKRMLTPIHSNCFDDCFFQTSIIREVKCKQKERQRQIGQQSQQQQLQQQMCQIIHSFYFCHKNTSQEFILYFRNKLIEYWKNVLSNQQPQENKRDILNILIQKNGPRQIINRE